MEKKIIDVTCGARSIWFNKHHPAAVYCDKRREKYHQMPFTRYGPGNWIINKYEETEKDTAQFLINQFGAEIVECIEDNENLLIKKDEKIIAIVCKEWFPNVTEKTKLSDIVVE